MEPENRLPFKKYLRYLKNYYFKNTAKFNYQLWNHTEQVLIHGDCDFSTNSAEAGNRALNNDCPSLRTPESIFQKIYTTKAKQIWDLGVAFCKMI